MSSSPLFKAYQIEAADAVAITRYSAMAMFSLSVYEWLLSLQEEVALIHQARWTSVRGFYLLCRYYPLVYGPLLLWAWVPDHDSITCSLVSRAVYIAVLPCPLSAQAVMLIRAHAFTGRKKTIFITLLLGFLGVVAAHIWMFGTQYTASTELATLLGNNGCFEADKESVLDDVNAFVRARRAGLVLLGSFLLDLLAMIIVIVHCFKIRSTQGSLGRTFLKQGAFAFCAISLVTLIASALCLQTNRLYNGASFPFLWMGSPMVACRLILQLRQKISPTETQQVRMHSRIVREAFDEIDELEHFEPEREQWISTWDAELDSSWLQSSETRTSTSRTPHSRTSIKAASDPSHC